MSKKNLSRYSKSLVQCRCSRCDMVEITMPGTKHHNCSGIDAAIRRMLPEAFKNLTNPSRGGTWERVIEEKVA